MTIKDDSEWCRRGKPLKTEEAKAESVLSDLLCCPWCGETKTLFVIDDGGDTRPRKKVFCPMCNIVGPEGLDEKGAIEQWNRRAI